MKILLHACCGPCSLEPVRLLRAAGHDLTIAYMNSNIAPADEYARRLSTLRAWAGVDASKFARVTSFENYTSVKPKLAYYAENVAACGLSGDAVLMVGNNTVEDLAIRGLGADAFLVTDHLLDPTEGFDLGSVKHGTMEEFAAWAEERPPCADPAQGVEAGAVPAAAREAALSARSEG